MLPADFKERMRAMLGDEYEKFEKAHESAPIYTGLRINALKDGARDKIFEKFGEIRQIPWCVDGFHADKSKISGNHPYHLAGLFYFQEPSAMTAAECLPIEEGDFVLDLCAAPGGKATQAAAKLKGTGLLAANEIIRKRAEVLSENIERMGIKNAVVMNENPARLAEKFPSFFDKIIVDAPCSGEGMFRKEPQAAEEWSVEHVRSCAERQRKILECAVKMLKKGGMLVYSTCTFAEEENEENADYLINTLGLEPVGISLEGVSAGINMPKAVRIFPHISEGEGHFAALFQKTFGESGQRQSIKTQPPSEAVRLYREFEKDSLNIRLDGDMCLFGSRLYLLPEGIDIDKLKVLRAGLLLGECKKNRFEPSHALALALSAKDFKRSVNLPAESAEMKKYLGGDVIPCGEKGYTAVLADGFPIGWGKASQGILKNHFPKHLRVKG